MKRLNTTYSSHPNRASRAAHERAKKQYPTYDTSLIRPKGKTKKPLIVALVIAGAVVLIAVIAIIFACNGCSKTLAAGQTAEVTIEAGSTTWTIADKMAKAGVVENPAVFTTTVVEMGAESDLKSGTYIFEGGKSVRDYVQILCDGPDASSPKVVVIEGMRLNDIASAVETTTKSRISSDTFIKECSDASKYADKYTFLESAGNNSLEGFLFPKTYSISNNDSARVIIEKMLDQFEFETKDLDLSYPKSKNLSYYDFVTLSSIVEKESHHEVRGKVASVFYNRLTDHMYLNSDATTAYEVGHDPTGQEVHSNSPYSTYTNYGLPPTPICSPGIESLKSVCYPENTNYYFFYFKTYENGETKYKFSETFDEHQQAILDLGFK